MTRRKSTLMSGTAMLPLLVVPFSLLLSSCATSKYSERANEFRQAFNDVQCESVVGYYNDVDANLRLIGALGQDKELQYKLTAGYCVYNETKSEEVFNKLVDSYDFDKESIDGLIDQGGCLDNEGDFSLASVYYVSAYKVAVNKSNIEPSALRETLELAILSYQNVRNFKAALWLLDEKRELLENHETSPGLLLDHTLDHAATYQLNGDYAAARNLYTQALSYMYDLEATDSRLADIYLKRGLLAIKQGLNLEAQNDLLIAYRFYSQDTANLGLVALHLGRVFKDAGKISDAEKYFKLSVAYRDNLYTLNPSPGRAIVLADSQIALAELMVENKELHKAQELYQQSLVLLTPLIGKQSERVTDIERRLSQL